MHLVCLSCATGIGLTLNNVQYTNNSVVTITDIGTGSAALLCTTTYTPCCFSIPPPGNHWYFPNGSRVQNTDTLPYYRRRTDAVSDPPGRVILNRNPWATTTGIFRCEILDASGDFQSIYVGIYTATTGEPCTLKRNKFVYQELITTNIIISFWTDQVYILSLVPNTANMVKGLACRMTSSRHLEAWHFWSLPKTATRATL